MPSSSQDALLRRSHSVPVRHSSSKFKNSKSKPAGELSMHVVLGKLRGRIRETVKSLNHRPLRTRFDTSDIVQESLIQIWQDLSIRGVDDIEYTRALLTVIAKGHASKLRRFHHAKKRDVGRETGTMACTTNGTSDPRSLAEIKENISVLIEALEVMHPVRRLIIFRRFFDDASYIEIARELKRSKDWVRRQYLKAISEIKVLISEN